jgi:hypothetical protein
MKTSESGPSVGMQVSFVPTTVDASGLGEAEMFATRSGDMLRSRSTLSDEARVANAGAVKKAANRSSAGSRLLLTTLKNKWVFAMTVATRFGSGDTWGLGEAEIFATRSGNM